MSVQVIRNNDDKAGPEGTTGIPKRTKLADEGEKARIFFAVYPDNWREKLTIYE